MRMTTFIWLATFTFALVAGGPAWAVCDDIDHDGDGCTCIQGDCNDDPLHGGGAVRGGSCQGGAFPDICDGLDNDCNAGTAEGSAEAWYHRSCDGDDSDACEEGIDECVEIVQGTFARRCSDDSGDNLELCNAFDDDCLPTPDGSDEPWLGAPCDGPDADFCDEGTYSCTAGGQVCSDTSGNNLDLCNGSDDDCNPATTDGEDESWFGAACDGPDTDHCNEGTFGCTAGAQSCSDTTGNNLELCNGTNDDCLPTADGVDETWYGDPCDGPDSDACEEGTLGCSGGAQTCSDTSGNNLDLCNGSTNDDCRASTPDGSDESWFGDPCDGPDADECPDGQWECNGSQVCSDGPGSATETCNGIDDDCNLIIDDPWQGVLGDPCDGGDVDLCFNGTIQCNVAGDGTRCVETLHFQDLCNGNDEDCNPATADGSAESWLGQACDGPDGDLCTEGVYSCVAGGRYCSDTTGDIQDLCNGADDDCNPATPDGDDEPWYGNPCDGPDTDQCDEGTLVCVGGGSSCNDNSGNNVESCNGIDDDCNLVVDDPWAGQLGQACDGNDTDLCVNGTWVCRADGSGVRCAESRHYFDLCNGADEDCNPVTPDGSAESNYNVPCDGPDSDQCIEGQWECNGISMVCTDTSGNDVESCNGIDDDCVNGVDDPFDTDHDGYFDCAFCAAHYGADLCDCNDGNRNIHPGAQEVCDGVDNDCDGDIDEGFDRDGDGWIACSECNWPGMPGCDCDDTPGSGFPINPGATEVCDCIDHNCDGNRLDYTIPGQEDIDRDGVPVCSGMECNDSSGAQRGTWCGISARNEICDGRDNDCNPATVDGSGVATFHQPCDGADTDLCQEGRWECNGTAMVCSDNTGNDVEMCDAQDHDCDGNPYNGMLVDGDGDTYIDCSVCQPPSVPDDQCDCRDDVGAINPGALEKCDTIDNNCDGHTDETPAGDPLVQTCYTGPPATRGVGLCRDGAETCGSSTPGVWSSCTGDTLPEPEECDTEDHDCEGHNFNGMITDGDGDGVRLCGSCQAPAAPHCDCDDARVDVRPGFPEQCDDVDHDCDGTNNNAVRDQICFEGPNVVEGVTHTGGCADNDPSCSPRGECRSGTRSCTSAGAWSSCGGTLILPSQDPALDEVLCDQRDDDCDGTVDDGDFDGDNDGAESCDACGHLELSVCDCDDTRNDVKPGGTEVCDGADNDCNYVTDDDGAGGVLTRDCYTGPADSEGTGLCVGGYNLCESGQYIVECFDEVVPAPDDPCDGDDNDCDGEVDEGFDSDQDGWTTCAGDCVDSDADIYPGNLEICDGKDNDCDGTIDGVDTACYTGPRSTLNVGLCHAGVSQCENGAPVGECVGEVVPVAELCPTGEPDCSLCDGDDNDCDGEVDEDFDRDGDGFLDCTYCTGLVGDKGCDCDDGLAYTFPGQIEFCDCADNNCDGLIDILTNGSSVCDQGACHDFDSDGYRNCDGDCNDLDSRVGPGFPEQYGDGLDNDCDGAVDEDVDEDQDGFTTGQGDCNDNFAEIHPGAEEVCDGFDNNCDGVTDEGFDQDGDHATTCAGDCADDDPLRSPFFREICGDGIDNDCNGWIDFEEDADLDGDGVTLCQGDCNDHNANVHGGVDDGVTLLEAAEEVCDGQDNDCDGYTDESFDDDHDGWPTCFGDCDPEDPAVNPAAVEDPYNGKDDDCDGEIDEGLEDLDGDGFSPFCGDCNDLDPNINPHAAEACDRIDNNCDGYVDAELGRFNLCNVCYDADADGYTNCDGDCDDTRAAVYPGATEVCDLLDNDCDHSVDLDEDGHSLCLAVDAGPDMLDAGPDGMSALIDAGQDPLVLDAGTTGPEPIGGVVKVGCHCGATSSGLGFWPLALGMLGIGLRRRRWWMAIAGLVVVSACDLAVQVPGVIEPRGDSGVDVDGLTPDADQRDAGPLFDTLERPDLGERDQVAPDRRASTCSTEGVTEQEALLVPGCSLPFAVPPLLRVTTLVGLDGLALDDDQTGFVAFVLHLSLPEGVSSQDPTLARTIAETDLQVLDALPSPPQAANRTEEHRRVFVDPWGRGGVTSLQRLEFPTPVTAYQLRDNILSALTQIPVGSIGNLPEIPGTASVAVEHVVQLLFAVDPEGIIIVAGITTAEGYRRNQTLLGDLTNGTHLGVPRYNLSRDCEPKVLPELKSDFLWVIDNSNSMQEEQHALADAAGAFYAALRTSGIDFRLGVVTTDSPTLQGTGFSTDLTSFEQDVLVGINGNGREMGLEYGIQAIELAEPRVADDTRRLRPDAALIVVFFSDEDSLNLSTVPEYTARYLEKQAVSYAIVGPRPWGCQRVGLGVARAGLSYIEVAESTGGATGSICNPNLEETITSILIGAAGAASKSPLYRMPVSNSLAVRYTLVELGDLVPAARSRSLGFDYEPGRNTILFFGDQNTLPLPESRFEAAYQFFAPPEG